jgi:hypothetical protein
MSATESRIKFGCNQWNMENGKELETGAGTFPFFSESNPVARVIVPMISVPSAGIVPQEMRRMYHEDCKALKSRHSRESGNPDGRF